jgi:hypothetical protein
VVKVLDFGLAKLADPVATARPDMSLSPTITSPALMTGMGVLLGRMGGPAITLADINDVGDIVGTRSNGGAAWNGLFLYRNGTFFSIQLPSDFEFPG